MASDSAHTLEMGSADPSFQLHKLGTEAGPLQFLRELTQNGFEAIAKTSSRQGVVAWQPWDYETSEGATVRKLAVFDTGCGMSAEELETHLNRLSSSGSSAGKSEHGNFGIGAKITALRYNPHGVLYVSLKDGHVSKMQLHRDSDGTYGVRLWPAGAAVIAGDLSELPPKIRAAGHGTLVVLLGETDRDDTAVRPNGLSGSETAWLAAWLNGRYLAVPEGVELYGFSLVRSGFQSRPIRGSRHFITQMAAASGQVSLDGASVYWAILREDARRGNEASYTPTTHHVAVIRGDEAYELHRGTASLARLRRAGIVGGEKNVLLHIEPDPAIYVPNTVRSLLTTGEKAPQGGGQPLPVDEWLAEFAGKLPAKLAEYVDKHLAKLDGERKNRIEDSLRDFLEQMGFSRLKRSDSGNLIADPLSSILGGTEASTDATAGDGDGEPGGEGGQQQENDLTPSATEEGVTAKKAGNLIIPNFDWKDELDHLPDRAAEFLDHLDGGRGRLSINANFRGFKDLTTHIIKAAQLDTADATVHKVATALVQDHFTQVLLESVMSLRHLRSAGGKTIWYGETLEKALSPEALTMVCLQRQDAAAKLSKELRKAPELKVRGR